jgi:hypothetical protein
VQHTTSSNSSGDGDSNDAAATDDDNHTGDVHVHCQKTTTQRGGKRGGVPSIREDKGEIILTNVRRVRATDASATLKLLKSGLLLRATGATQMNAVSSRSHAIFTLYRETTTITTPKNGGKPLRENVKSKFHFVDLAGRYIVQTPFRVLLLLLVLFCATTCDAISACESNFISLI